MTVGDRIRIEREKKNWTQEELAKRAGYSGRSPICKIETSGDDITTKKIKRMADALNVSIPYLMGWENESHENEIKAAQIVRENLINNDERLFELINIYEKLDNESKDMLLALAKKLI